MTKIRVIHPGNYQCFVDEYKKQLEHAVKTRPDEYAWPMSEFDAVLARIENAIKLGRFNKESSAFKATCKALGIKHTYRAIDEFILTIPAK